MKTDKLNKEFSKATKAQKRVMIAKDVLAQIKAKRYLAKSGNWVKPNWNKYKKAAILSDPNDSIQQAFQSKTIESCKVCALGGLFMSCVNLNNNTTVQDFDHEVNDIGALIQDDCKLSNKLNEIFTKHQLILIEQYFENGMGWFGGQYDDTHRQSFNDAFPDHDDRLTAIMENIVENNGTFKPNKLKI